MAFSPYLFVVFFGALLLARAWLPKELVFDEIHYVPAAKSLILLQDNINWMHPPGAKIFLGLGWLLFTKLLGVMPEPGVFRIVSGVFGLWALWGVYAWMLSLGVGARAAVLSAWLTGFNFLWFVQSKTAMLDIFSVALGVWGLLEVWRGGAESGSIGPRYWLGWACLGLAISCKWSALPFLALAFVLSQGSRASKLKWLPGGSELAGGLIAGVVYLLTFVPLAYLEANSVPLARLWAYHERMLWGFAQIADANHPYDSSWWQWPLLWRPMWYYFEVSSEGDRYVWAGGNPALFLVALPLVFVVAWAAVRHRDKSARVLSLLYWVPLLFWAVAPRKLQLYYYYLAPSLWLGPLVVWAHEQFAPRFGKSWACQEIRHARGWLLLGFVLLCAVTFLYFLPVMDARLVKSGRYLTYMWFRRWI